MKASYNTAANAFNYCALADLKAGDRVTVEGDLECIARHQKRIGQEAPRTHELWVACSTHGRHVLKQHVLDKNGIVEGFRKIA